MQARKKGERAAKARQAQVDFSNPRVQSFSRKYLQLVQDKKNNAGQLIKLTPLLTQAYPRFFLL